MESKDRKTLDKTDNITGRNKKNEEMLKIYRNNAICNANKIVPSKIMKEYSKNQPVENAQRQSNNLVSRKQNCFGAWYRNFFIQAFKIVVHSWKFTVISIHLMRWLNNFYDFRFKSTATAAIGIHPTKAWLSQLVNFKNTIWTWGHFRRTICNKILF